MKVKLIKPLRYGIRIFPTGEIGGIVDVEKPFTFQGEPVYDFYVSFNSHKPIGIFKSEVEIIKENQEND